MPSTIARTKTDREYDFDLVLSGPAELFALAQPVVDAFFEACHGDCTPGVSCGVPQVSFTRRAATMKDAVLTAIAEVRKVGFGIDVLAVEWSYLLTQADIGRRIGKSRQLVHQYVEGVRGPGGFPPPARNGHSGPLWQWSDVAQWLFRNGMAPQRLLEDAKAVETINCVLDYTRLRKHEAALVREVQSVMSGKKTA